MLTSQILVDFDVEPDVDFVVRGGGEAMVSQG
jgi:hypothetical protein